MKRVLPILFLLLPAAVAGRAGEPARPSPGEAAHAFLQRLCDDIGPRVTGSAANEAAMDRIEAELRAMGYEPTRDRFIMPGWKRGDDRVEIIAPFPRRLRVAALGYSQAHPAFEAEVVNVGNGRPQDYPAGDLVGRIGLLGHGTPLQASEFLAAASSRGLRGLLFINREGGGQLLARTASFSGAPTPLPVYSLAQEEGLWIARLLARGTPVRVRMETRSTCGPVETANLHVLIRGRSPSRLIVGAHLDSWDLGQGAMDNGIGIAQLIALASALRQFTPHHTVEIIWFNGEEQGLHGSRHAAARLGETPVVAMLNLDMVGVPWSVNALGDDSLVPALERWQSAGTAARRLSKGVENINWVASDHTPYQLAGVRALTFNGPIPRESVRFYHDMADTIDKVTPELIRDSSTVIMDLVRALAADSSLQAWRREAAATRELFTRFDLQRRMAAMGLWPPPGK